MRPAAPFHLHTHWLGAFFWQCGDATPNAQLLPVCMSPPCTSLHLQCFVVSSRHSHDALPD